jgi:hypothetical protein
MLDERVYVVRDAQGNECKVTGYRVVSPDELVLVTEPETKVNTRTLKSLPVTCRGDRMSPLPYQEMDYLDSAVRILPNPYGSRDAVRRYCMDTGGDQHRG